MSDHNIIPLESDHALDIVKRALYAPVAYRRATDYVMIVAATDATNGAMYALKVSRSGWAVAGRIYPDRGAFTTAVINEALTRHAEATR